MNPKITASSNEKLTLQKRASGQCAAHTVETSWYNDQDYKLSNLQLDRLFPIKIPNNFNGSHTPEACSKMMQLSS